MNKQELIHRAAERGELTQEQMAVALNAITDTIVDAVAQGCKVQLIGFGTFEGKKREARTGHNPRTKELIEIPASTLPIFKAGKAFKDAVQK